MVNNCDFTELSDCVVCSRCGYRICSVKLPVRRACDVQLRHGLGDMVKAGLSAIGVTEERLSKAIGRPCGCSQRAEALNSLGRKFGIG